MYRKLTNTLTSFLLVAVMLVSAFIVPAARAEASETDSKVLVLVANGDTWTALENMVVKSPKGNLMLLANSMSKKLGLTYKNVNSKKFTIAKGKEKLTFTKGKAKYQYKNTAIGTKKTYKSTYASYSANINGTTCNLVHFGDLKHLMNVKYFSLKNTEYEKLGYTGAILFDATRKIEDLPKTTSVFKENGGNNNGNGGGASYSGKTITTDSGYTVPILSEFNSSGMNLDNSWAGPWGEADATMQIMANTIDGYDEHHRGASNDFFMPNDNTFEWYSTSMDGSPEMEIRKCGNYYMLIINGPNMDVATAHSMGWGGVNETNAMYARDALTVMLSLVSSTPQELQSAIIRDMFTQTCISDSSYTKVGDCSIMASEWDFENGNCIMVYKIR